MTSSNVHQASLRRLLLFVLLVPSHHSPGQTSPFHFAWLSDTHIGSPTSEEDLRQAVRDIDRNDSISFVIISGDITELGWNAQFATAKHLLDSLNKPYEIIPGNHDTKWSESGCTQFSKVWGSDRFVFEFGGFRFIGLHEGPVMRMGDGHFAPEDLRWMDSVLAKLKDPRQPLFFVTHYPLDNQLDNWYEMTGRLKRYNTQAVLCGHGHANKALNFEGIPGVMGRSTLRAQQSEGGYTIATVRRDSMFIFERRPGKSTTLWDRLAIGQRNYASDTTGYSRPDFSVNARYPNVREVWRRSTGFTIASAPAFAGNAIVVGNSSGSVECLSAADGDIKWKYQTGGPVYSSPAIAGDNVVFGSSDRSIYNLRLSDGTVEWRFETREPVVGCPAIVNGVVYIGGSDSTFRAINLATGKSIWQFNELRAFVECRPLVYQNKVYFGAWDTYFYALSASNGTLAWRWSNGSPTNNLSPAACWPVASGEVVYIVAPDRIMTALDAETGRAFWRSNAHQVREGLGISNDGFRIFAKCMNDTLFAFSADTSRQRIIWATDCKFGYDIDPSALVEKDGLVYLAHKNGTVYAVDSRTGTIQWAHKISNTIVNPVAPGDNGDVAITDADGSVVLLQDTGRQNR